MSSWLEYGYVSLTLGWEGKEREDRRGPDAATGHDEIVIVAHAPDRLDDLALIVSDYFHAFELDAQGEAEFGEEGGIGVDCLGRAISWVKHREIVRR